MKKARQGRVATGGRPAGAGSFEIPSTDYESGGRGGDMSAQIELAGGNEESLLRSGEISSGEGAATTAYDQESTGRGRRYGGVSMGAFDSSGDDGQSRLSASRFDTMAPRTAQEGLARRQGLMLLRLAGPSCNHPRCQKIRAKGIELLGAAIGSREMSSAPGVASGKSVPSVRKDVLVPPMRIRDEARGKERPVMSHGTGKSDDTGDWEVMYGQETLVPKYEPQDPKSPDWLAFRKTSSGTARSTGRTRRSKGVIQGSEMDYLEPTDYLEHHHYPGEELEPLPWER